MVTKNRTEAACREERSVESSEEPRIIEEIQVEELAIDGICGVY